MRYELDEKLVVSFPHLYRNRYTNMNHPAMCFGFQCGDGWFNLLWELSRKLEESIKSNSHLSDFRVTQVKEKFGGLRFYVSQYNDSVQGYIDEAERLSYEICEWCGEPGKPNKEGWIITLCDVCRQQQQLNSVQPETEICSRCGKEILSVMSWVHLFDCIEKNV